MKSLAWIEADNAEIEHRIATKRAASIRRLKQRIHNVLGAFSDQATRRKLFKAVDEWHAKETRRG